MQTLADKYPEAVAEMKAQGFKSLATMCGRFARASLLSDALGMDPSGTGVNKWLTRRNMPTWPRELAAKEWLRAQKSEEAPAVAVTPEVTSKPEPEPQGDILMVVAPIGKQGKVTRVLEMLGCEVVVV